MKWKPTRPFTWTAGCRILDPVMQLLNDEVVLLWHADQPEVEAGSGLVRDPGNLHHPWNLQFSNFGFLWDFLLQFTCRILYPFGRNLRLYQTSGITAMTTSVGRVWSSYTRRGNGLANSRPSAELRGSLDVGDRIKAFYVSRPDGTLQLLIF